MDTKLETIRRELHLYYCAGGHTRAQMAGCALREAGFKFDESGKVTAWPDGKAFAFDKDGNIPAHDWTVKPAAKVHTILKTRRGVTKEVTGTLAELTEYFRYTLEVGNSYRPSISLTPKTAASLVSNLNKAVAEKQRGSYDPDFYALKTQEAR